MNILHVALACLAGALSAAAPPSAYATPAHKAGQSAAANTPKKKTGVPKFIPSTSQESTRDRERRLLRECKGRPNAGACSGFTG